MYHNFYSVEHFARGRQQELLAAAGYPRAAGRLSGRSARRSSAESRPARRPTLFVRALAVIGTSMVAVGRRLEDRAAAAAKAAAAKAAAGICEEQRSAVGY
jgi:hypothetical protein